MNIRFPGDLYLDATQLPEEVLKFLSEAQPSEAKFNFSDRYTLYDASSELELELRWGELSLIEIAVGLGKVEHLEVILKNQAAEQMIAAYASLVLHLAILNGQVEMVKYLLTNAKILSHAEIHWRDGYHHYAAELYAFTKEKIAALRQTKKAAEEKNTTAFNVRDQEEAKICFYMVRHLIRRNSPELLEDIHFLLSIPAVRELAHQEVLGCRPNELLQLAIDENNDGAVNILMAIPTVRKLAAKNSYYPVDSEEKILSEDKESSMRALSNTQQKKSDEAKAYYDQKITEAGGVENVFENLYLALEERYKANPIKIAVNDKEIILPLAWNDFEALGLTDEIREIALQAYYQDYTHTAYRYLSRPNPWISPTAENVYRDSEGGWSTFEHYKNDIARLYLAVIDQEMEPINGFTMRTRYEHFLRELAAIGRSHNWDKTRPKEIKGKNGEIKIIREEYDDLESDNPSCYSGVNRRLGQAVLGHPLYSSDVVLTKGIVDQELSDFAKDFVEIQMKERKVDNKAVMKQYNDDYIPMLEIGGALRSVIAISLKEQERFVEYLAKKYGDLFDLPLKARVFEAFEKGVLENSDMVNAIAIGTIDWGVVFRPTAVLPSDSGFFSESAPIPSSSDEVKEKKEKEIKEKEVKGKEKDEATPKLPQ